jgi:hypothetical protein
MDSEDWKAYNEDKKRRLKEYQTNYADRDQKLLEENPNVLIVEIKDDGNGGELFVLEIKSPFGIRDVYWWKSTGRWKAKVGKASGYSTRSILIYYKVMVKNENDVDSN